MDTRCRVEGDRFISVSAGIDFEEVTLPLQCRDLHTCYFRVHSGGMQVSDGERRFCAIAWEILQIFKENFPSRVALYQENIELSGV
jgi:hypothetical protein